MPIEDSGKNKSALSVAAGDPITTQELALEVLKSRADLSYFFFEDLDLSNVVARQSLFHGALFRNCKITDSDFSRCDFEGVRFESCTLTNVSFETADIRSTKFARSQLISTTMRSSVCSDNIFRDCIIEECEFDDASVLRCDFSNCKIRKIKNRTATWLHTVFGNSQLEQLAFTDCTASYTIYDQCTFINVTINADALGLSFGLNQANLEDLQFGFLGETYDAGTAPELESFLEQYQKRNWYFHSFILSLNFRPEKTQHILLALFKELGVRIRNKTGVKLDDVEFLFNVMTFLNSKQRLPFSTAVFAHDLFSDLEIETKNISTEDMVIRLGRQKALYLATTMYSDLLEATSLLTEKEQDENIEATITYGQKPETTTIEYVGCVEEITARNRGDINFLEAREGSWIEVLQMSLGSLFAFYIALYLVNGCLAQLTMVRARSKKLVAKRLPSKFLQAASDPHHDMPKIYQDILQKLLLSQIDGDIKATEALESLTRKDIDGLNIDIREINT